MPFAILHAFTNPSSPEKMVPHVVHSPFRRLSDYTNDEIEWFYTSMVELMRTATEPHDDEWFPINQERFALVRELHGENDETGASDWDTTMEANPWPSEDILRPSFRDGRIICGRVKTSSSASSLVQS
jgi:hypothetical protein